MNQLPSFSNEDITEFPSADTALTEPDGLLCFGGNLSSKTLQLAYANGIFPWFGDNEPIMWWSPSIRSIIPTAKIHISKNMKKLIKQNKYKVSFDNKFQKIVSLCAAKSNIRLDTWITQSMQSAYSELYKSGAAHSIEVTNLDGEIVGGLYGIFIGNIFCGESMFSKENNTSKLALIELAKFLHKNNCDYIDCQMTTEHLSSMGAESVNRNDFINLLQSLKSNENLINNKWCLLWQH